MERRPNPPDGLTTLSLFRAVLCLGRREIKLSDVPAFLRYVLGRGNTTRGQCRLCQKGNENNAHLVECPHLPVKFITWREELYDAIASQVGHRRSNTRSSLDLLHRFLTNMQWPKAHKLLVKRVVAYHRSLINMYAQLAPPRWEDPNTRDITIRRVRTPRPPIRINRNPQ